MQKIALCVCLGQGFYNKILNGLAKSRLLVSYLEDKTAKLKKEVFWDFKPEDLFLLFVVCGGDGGVGSESVKTGLAEMPLFWTCVLSICDQYMRPPQVWQD